MSLTSVDFPDPDTPVTAMNSPSGSSTVRLRRLWWRAPTMRSTRSPSDTRRLGGAAEGEVIEPHVVEEAQPVLHFLEDGPGDLRVESGPAVAAQRQSLEEPHSFGHREVHHVAETLPADQHREALGTQPLASARGTRLFDHISLELVAHAVRGGLAVALLDVLEDAGPARLVRAVPALAVVLIGERAARRALQEALLHDRGEILPWHVEVGRVRPGQRRT